MITVFTICSVNYLAQAKTLGDSLILHNPEYQFVIGLVDRIEHKIEPSYWKPYELIEVENLKISNFDALCRKYNIVELNTAVKPFYIEYLYRRDPNVKAVIYIDPDILIYRNFEELEEKLNLYNIILTPHSFTVGNEQINITYEVAMLRTGLYNLGFLATSRSDETFTFLNWWQERLKQFCFYRPGTGLFVDQIWANFVPFYYQKVYVEKSPGYNISYWNLFERTISYVDGKYVVNGKYDLIFYHFSSYNPFKPELISNRGVYTPLAEREDVHLLFEDYRQKLLSNNYEELRTLKCYFMSSIKKNQNNKNKYKVQLKKSTKKVLSLLPYQVKQLIKKVNLLILDSI